MLFSDSRGSPVHKTKHVTNYKMIRVGPKIKKAAENSQQLI